MKEQLVALRSALVRFDPASLSGDDCRALVHELAATENACAVARARAAARAAASGSHRADGFRDATDWLANATGTSAGEAKAALETGAALDACPTTRDAAAAGELSLPQAREITRTEQHAPGSEHEMVDLARGSSLAGLQDEGRKRRFAAADVEDLHARQRKARSFRHWRDELGMVRCSGALPPEVGVPFVNRLEAETDRVRRAQGREESREAHMADAFVALMSEGGGARRGRSADVVFVCDVRAYRRGHAHDGEPCHLIGGGPVPVSVVRDALDGDAFLKAVVHDGTRIETVVHYGRHIPAEVRTALELGPPPSFEGRCCVEAGCGRRHGLQFDHRDPVANRGPTSLANLQPLCWNHHQDKTERDRAAGRLRAPP